MCLPSITEPNTKLGTSFSVSYFTNVAESSICTCIAWDDEQPSFIQKWTFSELQSHKRFRNCKVWKSNAHAATQDSQQTCCGWKPQSESWRTGCWMVSANILLTWMEFTQVKDLDATLMLKISSKINMSYKLLEAIFNSNPLHSDKQFIINAKRNLEQYLCH